MTNDQASDGQSDAPRRDRRALKSAGWTTIGHGLAQVIRLLSSVILTRFLVPEIYGLMELVWVFYAGFLMFSDVGLASCIVQSPRGEDTRFLNTAWTLQAARGGLLFVLALLVAYPASLFFNQPSLVYLLPAIGVTALIEGFDATSIHTEARRLNLSSVVKLELSMQVSAVVVQIVIAAIWPSVWALVIGSWVGSLVKLYGSHRYLRSIAHRFDWDREAVKEIFNFGKWIFGSTALHFVSSQGDRLILARLLEGMSTLGIYAIAGRLRTSIQQLQLKLVRSVVFPALAEKSREFEIDDPERIGALTAIYYRTRLRLDALFVTGSGFLMAFSTTFISVLYATEYEAAGKVLQIFSIELAMSSTLAPSETLLFAVGATKYGFFRSLGRAIWIVTAVPLGWFIGGFWGLVWAVSLAEIPTMIVLWSGLARYKFLDLRRELRALGFFIVGLLLGYAFDAMVRPLLL